MSEMTKPRARMAPSLRARAAHPIFEIGSNNQRPTNEYSCYYQTPLSLQQIFSGNLQRDSNWGRATSLQAPRDLRLGAKWSF